MRNNIILKISAGIVAIFLILIVFLFANSFAGNPISSNLARSKATSYINDKYSHFDLELGDVTYDAKNSYYYISVNSKTSVDTHFNLGYRKGEICYEDYETLVLSSMNTMERFCNEYEKSLTPLVQVKTIDVTNISVIPEKLAKYDLELDSDFEKSLIKNVDIAIKCTGGTDAEYLSDVLKTTYNVMKENGYEAKSFGITGEYESETTQLINIKPLHIENENLSELLQEAITNTEFDGIISFSKGLK